VPSIIYTGVQGHDQLPCLATSLDDDLIAWEKHPANPVIAAPPAGVETVIFRDHAVWKENGAWHQLVGSGIKDVGGAALLYRSADLIEWEYLHPIYLGDINRREPLWTGLCWECPDFFALGDRHVLMFSIVDEHDGLGVASLVGDYAGLRFTPVREDLADHGSTFYAPQSFLDERGRRIMFGWLRETRSEQAQRNAGWSGVMSLPRVLTLLPDGALGMAPVPEVEGLRGSHQSFNDLAIAEETEIARGDALEIAAAIDPGSAAECGLKVRCSPDGAEETLICYDRSSRTLTVDARRSTRDPEATGKRRSVAIDLSPDGLLKLRIFIDRSVIEVFVNGRTCLTERVYPSLRESLGVRLFARDGEATFRTLDAWELNAT
jgi:beta-fructofuranosidase